MFLIDLALFLRRHLCSVSRVSPKREGRVVEEVPGNWEWAKDGEAEEPCEVRESLRQVEKAQGEVRKPKCQKKED